MHVHLPVKWACKIPRDATCCHVFGDRFYRIRVDGMRMRKEKVAFSNENGYVWTGPFNKSTQGVSYKTEKRAKLKKFQRPSCKSSRTICWRFVISIHLVFLQITKGTLHVDTENISFMFSWQKQYCFCFCHSNIKFISSRHHVISSLYIKFYLGLPVPNF